MNPYFRYLYLAPASIVMSLIGGVVVPVAMLRGGVDSRLPAWAWYWDNNHEPWGDTARRPAIEAATGWRKAWLRFQWLAIRNPANNFGVAKAIPKLSTDTAIRRGNQMTSDQYSEGWKFNRLVNGKRVIAFEFYSIWEWKAGTCLRIRLGWKIDDYPARLVCVVNPFMPFKRKV